jgi:hypothetical protein
MLRCTGACINGTLISQYAGTSRDVWLSSQVFHIAQILNFAPNTLG